jgi:multiple sugar transport system permease protein
MNNSLSRRQTTANVLSYVGLVALALFFLFPLIFMFVSAAKGDEAQVLKDMSSTKAFIPYGSIGVTNFLDVFKRVPFGLAFFNSCLIVASIVALNLLINSMFAYALARIRFPGRNLLLTVVISLIIIPFEAVAIPLLLLVNRFGWLDSYHVQIIPFAASAFSIYLFYQFFISLPKELEEAAFVDGANRWRIYWQVVVPLSGPVFATVTVLQFLAMWGNLLWPVLVVRGERFSTLPYQMQTFFGQPPQQWGDIMAYATMATLPTLIIFLVFQRAFVRSVVGSGVKG